MSKIEETPTAGGLAFDTSGPSEDGNSKPITSSLLLHHKKLIESSAVSDEVARIRGYQSVTVKAKLKDYGFTEAQRRVPALLIPVWGLTGEIVNYQIRPDEPRILDGKPIKYETPKRSRMALDLHPTARHWLLDVSRPIFITEGLRKADAAVSKGLCCIALLGVWNWRGKSEGDAVAALPDWEKIPLKGRNVYICFDNDVMEKPGVQAALKRLYSFLSFHSADVRLIYLPVTEGGAKVGLDDFFAVGNTVDELLRHATTELRNVDGETEGGERRQNQATRLVAHASNVELFHSPDGKAYAAVIVGDHKETMLLKSRSFRDWLSYEFYKAEGTTPSAQGLQEAINVLTGRARFEGMEVTVHTRLAEFEGELYLDLCDQKWRAVRITGTEWGLIESHNCPVKFRRARGMLPLPEPKRGGSTDSLKRYINVGPKDFVLVLAWLVATFRPGKPCPILALHGEQGSAKSTTARILRCLVDPNVAALRSEPREARDLMIAATNGWLVAFDNLSNIPAWLSDALCRLSTGGGFATRELHSDDEEILFDVMRPVLLNGIEELETRSDLLDRTIVLNLPTIPEDKRRDEASVWTEFDRERADILGALLEAVSTGLHNISSVALTRLPRMADFALWATASEPALGVKSGTFIRTYTGNRKDANTLALEASPVATAVIALVERENRWVGTASELLRELNSLPSVGEEVQRQRGWPKTAQGISGILKRLAPNLRATGINLTTGEREGGTGKRVLRLERMDISSSQTSHASSDLGAPAYSSDDDRDSSKKSLSRQQSPTSQNADGKSICDECDNRDEKKHKLSELVGRGVDHYEIEERAAIMEFDGGLARDEAERLAVLDLREVIDLRTL